MSKIDKGILLHISVYVITFVGNMSLHFMGNVSLIYLSHEQTYSGLARISLLKHGGSIATPTVLQEHTLPLFSGHGRQECCKGSPIISPVSCLLM